MFKSSEVFTYINDEAIENDVEKELKRDTAFLQSCRQSNSHNDDDSENLDSTAISNHENLYDSFDEIEELPILWKCDKIEQQHAVIIAQSEPVLEQCTFDKNVRNDNNLNASNYFEENEQNNKKTENFSEQINNIQNQIHKLSNLPSIIQTAINDISKQIMELVPAVQEHQLLAIEERDKDESTKNIAQELHHEISSCTEDTSKRVETEDCSGSHSSDKIDQLFITKKQAKSNDYDFFFFKNKEHYFF